jgi:hypothetical protein
MRFVVALAAALIALPAQAASFIGEIRGVLTEQLDLSFNDPNLQVGDEIVLTTRLVDPDIFPELRGPGDPYTWVYVNSGLNAAGTSFSITSGSLAWEVGDEATYGTFLAIDGGKIINSQFWMVQAGNGTTEFGDDRPGLNGFGPNGVGDIHDATNVYFNTYKTPGFKVQWDIPGSSFTEIGSAVPEPSLWAMMIIGFGLVGASTRRRKAQLKLSGL